MPSRSRVEISGHTSATIQNNTLVSQLRVTLDQAGVDSARYSGHIASVLAQQQQPLRLGTAIRPSSHLKDGNLMCSLHTFRHPLISWSQPLGWHKHCCIAAPIFVLGLCIVSNCCLICDYIPPGLCYSKLDFVGL